MNSKSFFALSAAAAVAGMGLCAKFAAFGAPMGLAEIAAALVFLGASPALVAAGFARGEAEGVAASGSEATMDKRPVPASARSTAVRMDEAKTLACCSAAAWLFSMASFRAP